MKTSTGASTLAEKSKVRIWLKGKMLKMKKENCNIAMFSYGGSRTVGLWTDLELQVQVVVKQALDVEGRQHLKKEAKLLQRVQGVGGMPRLCSHCRSYGFMFVE